LEIPRDEVHAWRIALDRAGPIVAQLETLLSDDELERAHRFRFERDQVRFIVGRGSVRRILGRYLRLKPECLRFQYGKRGKPELAEGLAEVRPEFNLAHSQGLGLLAITQARWVGVDVEGLRPMVDAERIIHRFFSAAECRSFLKVAPDERHEAFFRGWTRKEAYIKAIGKGFAQPLDQFSVTLAPGEPPRLIEVAGREEEIKRWSMHDLDPKPGFLGAVVVEGGCDRIRRFQAEGWCG
jgi:4'-phosphopantetheinyl transferase